MSAILCAARAPPRCLPTLTTCFSPSATRTATGCSTPPANSNCLLLVEEGQDIGHISILIEGVMRMLHPDNPRQVISSVGPVGIIRGNVVHRTASATVKAVERCMLLTLPFGILQEKIGPRPGLPVPNSTAPC